MKRRTFLKRSLPAATVLPAVISGYTVKAFTPGRALLQAALLPNQTENVLVIVQLSGGNDGLNTVIPISTYDAYYKARTNIALPQNSILRLDGYSAAGLHPSMKGMQSLFNEGKAAIVQAVGYPSPNFSHFRATDIWMSASDANAQVPSGWGGRYLNNEFPDYPTGYPNTSMPDPLAIQIGSVTSLTCQGPVVNMGMSITDPTTFYNLINGVEDPVPDSPMGHELGYIRQVARQTNRYATRIKDAAARVTQQSAYPAGNYLADQLKIVARLIRGGLKTRIYMVSYGGFDTHSLQAVSGNTATGVHANLLAGLSAAVKSFMDDLKFLGIEDRVVGMTFSEFGRRIKSNASGGTDHGAAAPLFLFGKGVVGGVLGTNPAIPTAATLNDNIPFQYDFRSVYASLLEQWFCVPQAELQSILLKNFQALDLVNNPACPTPRNRGPQLEGEQLVSNYPNPFTGSTSIRYKTAGGHTLVQVIDMQGHALRTLVDRDFAGPGEHQVSFDSEELPSGVYYVRLQNGPVQQVRPMLKVR